MTTKTRALVALLLSLPLAVAGCFGGGGPGQVNCTADFRYGIVITLKDGAGTAICDATVEAVEGTYHETFEAIGCTYHGAGERAGVYDVTITKTGFQTAKLNIGVTKDECHVHAEQRNVTLVP